MLPESTPAGNDLVRLAIFGSCVTRDAFGETPQAHGIHVARLVSRSSVPSAVSRPIVVDEPALSESLSAFETRCIETDLAKDALERIAAIDPDYLLIDLIDERFPLIRTMGGGLLTRSFNLVNHSGIEAALPRAVTIPNGSEAALRHWARSARIFANRLRDLVRPDRLLIHRAFWAERYREDGKDKPYDSSNMERVRHHNQLLTAYYAHLEAALPEARIIDVPETRRVADPRHRWGFEPFHYIEAYYEDFRGRLQAVIDSDRLRGDRPLPDRRWTIAASDASKLLRGASESDLDAHERRYGRAIGQAGPEPTELTISSLADVGFSGSPVHGIEEEALDRGDAEMVWQVARARAEGILIERDQDKAYQAFLLAALLGHAEAGYEVAMRHFSGQGTVRDTNLGRAWLQSAADAGSSAAQRTLAELYEQGWILPQRPDAARALYRRAALAGDRTATVRLALMLLEGRGGPVDVEGGMKFLRRAALEGDLFAEHALRTRFSKEDGIEQQSNIPAMRKSALHD